MTTVEQQQAQEYAAALAARVEAVRARVADAARRAGRDPAEVRIVAVTKTFGLDAVRAAWAAGLRHFGENRVQEAEAKYTALRAELPDARLHLIGHLQSNKAKRAVELCDAVESLDSLRLAERLDRYARELGRRLDVFIQVNVAGAETQEGIAPAEVEALARGVARLEGLRLVGLMAIATNGGDEPTLRRDFRTLHGLRDHLRTALDLPDLRELSMGMTGDFELAIEEGSTLVRLGRVIFGERPYPAPPPAAG